MRPGRTPTVSHRPVPWSWLCGAVVLLGVVWWAGTGPFVLAVRSLDAGTLALGAALAVVVTVASAWRWCLVARGLGLRISLGSATAAYYRSQLLNSTLPGGVLGDVLRGVDQGRATADPRRAYRSVLWERAAGQAVQAMVVVVVLAVVLPPGRAWIPVVLVVLGVGLALVVVLGWRRPVLRADLAGLLEPRVWPGVVAASVLVVAGHVATFVLVARAVGVPAPVSTLVPVTLLVLVAAAIPANLAGWGPREGAAGWSFAVAGLDAAQGVAVAVAYGVVVVVATLPGLVLPVAGASRARGRAVPSPGGGVSRG